MVLNALAVMAHAAAEAAGASPVTGGTGFWNMVLGASPMVQAIICGLLGMSVLCWGIIVSKARQIRKAEKESERFLDLFSERKSNDALRANAEMMEESYLAHIFRTGYTELNRVIRLLESRGLRTHRDNPEILLENVDRAIQGGIAGRRKRLERLLPVLATTGSTAPFIGLFGTVWGIMTSFQEIGVKGSANLAVVAPGISEALVATAMGLAAAIPAVVAYNHFSEKILTIENDMTHFAADFLNTLKTDLLCRVDEDETAPKKRVMAG